MHSKRSTLYRTPSSFPHLLTDGAGCLLLLLALLHLALHGLVLLEARLRAKVLELALLADRRQEATVAVGGDVPLAIRAHLEGKWKPK